jgi:hypothetical protein
MCLPSAVFFLIFAKIGMSIMPKNLTIGIKAGAGRNYPLKLIVIRGCPVMLFSRQCDLVLLLCFSLEKFDH